MRLGFFLLFVVLLLVQPCYARVFGSYKVHCPECHKALYKWTIVGGYTGRIVIRPQDFEALEGITKPKIDKLLFCPFDNEPLLYEGQFFVSDEDGEFWLYKL